MIPINPKKKKCLCMSARVVHSPSAQDFELAITGYYIFIEQIINKQIIFGGFRDLPPQEDQHRAERRGETVQQQKKISFFYCFSSALFFLLTQHYHHHGYGSLSTLTLTCFSSSKFFFSKFYYWLSLGGCCLSGMSEVSTFSLLLI